MTPWRLSFACEKTMWRLSWIYVCHWSSLIFCCWKKKSPSVVTFVMFFKPTGVPFDIEEESVINGILTIDGGSVSERLKKVGNKPICFLKGSFLVLYSIRIHWNFAKSSSIIEKRTVQIVTSLLYSNMVQVAILRKFLGVVCSTDMEA